MGKSSLLNRMLGQKVAIVSSKPQTTRTRIMGVLTEGADQLVFIDTPGLMRPRNRLGDYMVRSVTESVSGVDACLLVVEAGQKISPADLDLIEKFRSLDMPAVLAINKIDLLQDKSILMAQIAELSELFAFEAVVPVSAQNGDGVRILMDELKKLAMPGGHFDDDILTDQPERAGRGDHPRKTLRLLDKEIPRAWLWRWSDARAGERRDRNPRDHFCERDSHKGINVRACHAEKVVPCPRGYGALFWL
ncbi:MAG: GTPase Era [Anaeromassilibacillus sp.]